MGLFQKLKRILKRAIECPDKYAQDLFYVAKIKRNHIKLGATLFVRDKFVAILVIKGRVTDTFVPGMHKLVLGSMPLTARKINFTKKKDKKPKEYFRGEIYFVNLMLLSLPFSFVEPALLREEQFGKVKVRANGHFSFHIENGKTFLEVCFLNWAYPKVEAVKNKLAYWMNLELVKQLEYLNPPLLEFATNNPYLIERMIGAIQKKFASFGMTIEEIKLEETFIPNKIAEMLTHAQMPKSTLLIGEEETQTAYIPVSNEKEAKQEQNRYVYQESSSSNENLQLQKEATHTLVLEQEEEPRNEPTKNCIHCGKTLDWNATACYDCGVKQNKKRVCPNCFAEVELGEFVCPNCKNIVI